MAPPAFVPTVCAAFHLTHRTPCDLRRDFPRLSWASKRAPRHERPVLTAPRQRPPPRRLRQPRAEPTGSQPVRSRRSGMGLGPAARGERRRRLSRFPRPRPGPVPGAAEESSQALVQLSPKEPQQGTSELSRSSQEGEKPVVNLETTPQEKRAELNSAPKPESAGKLAKQAAEGKPRPRPGDLIEIFRIGYEHWAIYVEDDCVVHLAAPSEEFEVGSITSVFSNRAVVKYSRLEDVLHGCSWKVNNKLDGTYLPLPVDQILQRTRKMINKIVQYSLIEGNCEHFVNDLRYGVPRSQQVEHALMEGAKAAGAVISAVVESIRPKPVTA
ncbi:phospholipase A and acyltransferase 5 [Mustela nigripes]|uniref:phospholipase A and acyltransferase 5 n=1 Tax=Mustela nigripes TaxID=77151 RepID=UPI0028156DBF|nr:phospholipase A and acyltransferase 5 [Mustela nigripes]